MKGLKTIIVGNVKMERTEFCSKLIAVSCDGASVMTGVKAGVGALLRKTQPSIITIHCLAHRLELSLIYLICNLPEKKAGLLNYLLGSLKMKVRRPCGNHGSKISVYPCKIAL